MAETVGMALLDAEHSYRFGGFVLEPARRTLSAGGQPVAVSARGFDILLYLIERRDRVVTKDELLAEVWRGVVVEENNLAVQVSALRRGLGQGPGGAAVIATVAGRGYRFVAALEADADAAAAAAPPEPQALEPPKPQALEPVGTAVARSGRWRALAAACVVGLALLAWALRPGTPGGGAPRLSIVVLPFRNLGGDAQQDYLADAIGDDLTTELSHLPGSVVIARSSADTYKGRAATAQVVGHALGVRYLLEGSLRPEGPMLHINAQLIDAASGAHLWASAFDVAQGGLGGAREAIVRRIASALDVKLVDVEGARALAERPDNPDAVDFYFRARSVLDRDNTLATLTEAQGLLERAVAKAPAFSEALSELGMVLLQKVKGFDDPAELADYARAKQVIPRAAALAPRDPAAVTALGTLAYGDGRCSEAEPNFRLALSLDRNSVRALEGLARCALVLGQMAEMIADLKEVLRLDPAGTRSAVRTNSVGLGYLMSGQAGEALVWFRRAGAGLSDLGRTEAELGWREWQNVYMIAATRLSGDAPESARLYAKYARMRPRRTVWQLSAYDSRALCALAGHQAYLAALHESGMPVYADEKTDFSVPPAVEPVEGGDFDATPLTIPNARVIDTAALHALLDGTHHPIILDVGMGAAVIPGAVWLWQQGLGNDTERLLSAVGSVPSVPVIVMSDGPFGWRSYNAALALVAKNFQHVHWYRGGEAGWTAAGYRADDRRSP